MKPFLLCLLMFTGAAAQTNSLTEAQKIEKLLVYIESMQDATFIRNGSAFKCGKAAQHLRGKYKRDGATVKTARDFIKQIASESSTSGKPYQIKFKDGTVKNAGDVLLAQLILIEQGN